MASVYSASSEGENALAAATAEGVVWLMGVTTVKAKVIEWGVSFDGTSVTAEPVRVRLVRTTGTGTTPTAATAVPWGQDSPAALLTPRKAFATAPTQDTAALAEYEVHPQAGLVIQYPLGREPEIDNTTSSGLVIECTAPAIVNAVAYIVWEE